MAWGDWKQHSIRQQKTSTGENFCITVTRSIAVSFQGVYFTQHKSGAGIVFESGCAPFKEAAV